MKIKYLTLLIINIFITFILLGCVSTNEDDIVVIDDMIHQKLQ